MLFHFDDLSFPASSKRNEIGHSEVSAQPTSCQLRLFGLKLRLSPDVESERRGTATPPDSSGGNELSKLFLCSSTDEMTAHSLAFTEQYSNPPNGVFQHKQFSHYTVLS